MGDDFWHGNATVYIYLHQVGRVRLRFNLLAVLLEQAAHHLRIGDINRNLFSFGNALLAAQLLDRLHQLLGLALHVCRPIVRVGGSGFNRRCHLFLLWLGVDG